MYGGRGRGGVEGVWGDFWNDLCLCAAKYWELLESACAVCGVVVKPERFTCSILQSTRSCTFLLEMHHLYVVGRKRFNLFLGNFCTLYSEKNQHIYS